MSRVRTVMVSASDADIRLDRWFKRHFPRLGHGQLEKLLRTGQVRLDGGRVKGSAQLRAGQEIRLPPMIMDQPVRSDRLGKDDREFIRGLVLYRDDRMIAIDKPAGLAVQGGTKVKVSVDSLLEGLRFEADERPRLVHRLDKATSGVLLLARNRRTAVTLTAAFRDGDIAKEYWALVDGVPTAERGSIDLALSKRVIDASGREQIVSGVGGGKSAWTDYHVVDRVRRGVAWLSLVPRTGRTHQLRVHCRALGTPILGDQKYGAAVRPAADGRPPLGRLMLHARAIRVPNDAGGTITITAPLDAGMRAQWAFFGFEPESVHGIE